MTLLHIDSSARQSSTSRRLTAQFVEAWRTAHPGDTIITRDLATTTLPTITDDWMATYSDPSLWTPAQRQYLALSDELIDELFAANVIVIGAPMYNLSISAQLKGWIDHVVRVGRTVAYDERGRHGLLGGRRVVVLSARGGSYRPGTPPVTADFQEPYLCAILQFIGLTDVTFVHADNQSRTPAGTESLAAALENVSHLVSHMTQEVVSHVRTEAH
jgi:FMN-dependent NADH-azoreductase